MTRIAIVIPSLGRRDIVSGLLEILDKQTRPAELICLAVASVDDAPPINAYENVHLIESEMGSCAQRNAALDYIGDKSDIIAFFDDDFIPAPTYLERLEAFFEDNAKAAGVTGRVLEDGVIGPGLSLDAALAIIERRHQRQTTEEPVLEERLSLYGCNMAFRRTAIENLRFDERLPLYGWLEDVDFSMQAKKTGPILRTSALEGVHLGVKGGRTSGVRFGYSQIINPVYLYRKKTMTLHHAFDNLRRNIISNHIRVFYPEPYVDRWGRVKGNWLAFWDILRGRITPERILKL